MKLRAILALTIFSVSILMLAACGGGGSASPTSSVNGVASAELVKNGVIKVYPVSADGSKGLVLANTTTDANGLYSINLGSYVGAVLVELSGGTSPVSTYRDEATGTDVTLPAGVVFLRAAVSSVTLGAPVTISLTPLSELAVQRATVAGKTLPAAITAANQVVSDLYNVDIVGVKPVAPTPAAMNATGITDAQRTYTLALAALSQQAFTQSGPPAGTTATMTAVISSVKAGIDPITNVMSGTTATAFSTALTTYVDGGKNTTGLTSSSPLVTGMIPNIGKRTATITLTSTGVTVKNVGTIDVQVNMPAGLYTFNTDTNGLVAAADVSTTTGGLVTARFATSKLSVAAANGTALVDGVITIKLQIDAGFDVSAVQIGSPIYKDLNGNIVSVSGALLALTVQ